MVAPGTRPASIRSGSVDGTGTSAASTVATVNGNRALSVPSITPVTTISSSRLTSAASEKSAVCSPAAMVTGRLLGRYPIARTRSWYCCPRTRSPGTVSTKRPDSFVAAV